MYLKKIEASGFKSFADKISIELPNTITGIVGPNGSGKSNVVDAVRWVLGEQSVKSLRGDGNMTDVIFSGSKSRRPMNVATVNLIFDNSDKYLNSPYEEVSIKRRVYKDGTNEYLINNEKCRLKDVTDLLMDSGIAKESFNIISQGKIEEIISSKPSERRVIFEEAAGVLKYKTRKKEALRKLERTHDNMNRVNDIISELDNRVSPLREQKEKAIIYKEKKEKLEKIEVAVITNDITNLNFKYQMNKQKIEELNKEIMSISTTNNNSEVEIEEYKVELNKLNLKLNKLQQDLLKKTEEVEKINSEKNILIERQKYAVADTKLHNNLIELREQELKLSKDINIFKYEIESIETAVNDIKVELEKLENEKNRITTRKNTYEQELTKKIREKSIIENKITYLRESIDNNSSLPHAVKTVLDNPKLRGIHNVIGSLIEFDESHMLAISTVLGYASTNIVVDDEICAKEAINYLKNNNLGRVTFFPLNIIKPKYIDSDSIQKIKTVDGFVDVASNLVKYDLKYKNIIENQLGNVIVAKDIDSANTISRSINYRYRVVTLDGNLLHVGGSLTGGSQIKSKNIITEKYELENNLKLLDNIINNIKDLENHINENDDELKNIEDKIYTKHRNYIATEQSRLNKINNLEENQEKYNSIQKEISGTEGMLNNNLDNEEQKLLKKYYEELELKTKLETDLENVVKKRDDLNTKLEEFEFSLKRENSLFNSKNKELKELEIEVTRMDVKLDNLLNKLNETYSLTYEKAFQLYELNMEEEKARNLVSTLKKEINNLGPVNINAIEEYDEVSERYEFLNGQKDDLVKAENTLLEIIDEMDSVMKSEFENTFKMIESNFATTFKELFKGGHAKLKLTDPDNMLETGIEIEASPPGKKLTSISLLSGGEKTFTAISLLFAILKSRPVPFCILDEVEAALDEVNVDAFGSYLTNLKEKTQFILITHKKKTMEYADVLYGITMQESGVSKLVSVKLEEIKM